jgi:peroxiredoxin
LKFSIALLTAFVFAATPAGNPTAPYHTQPPGQTGSRGPLGAEPPATLVAVGDPAPDFSYPSQGRSWLHLHDLLAQGSVLLVFATEDEQLVALQDERARLMDLGVIPVAVVDRRSGAAASTVKRLGLQFPVIADLQRTIATQFNVLDPDSRRTAPAWFVINHRGWVRALNRGSLPSRGYPNLAASALSIPLQGVPVPAGTRPRR